VSRALGSFDFCRRSANRLVLSATGRGREQHEDSRKSTHEHDLRDHLGEMYDATQLQRVVDELSVRGEERMSTI
jgi:hypothetical protein